MKDAALQSPSQRAVALTRIAEAIFDPRFLNETLDTPREEFNGASVIQHARKGVEEFRQAERYLKTGLVFA